MQALLFDAQAAVLEAGHEQRVVYSFLLVFCAIAGAQLFLQNILLVAQVGELFDELFNPSLGFARANPIADRASERRPDREKANKPAQGSREFLRCGRRASYRVEIGSSY